MLFVAGVMTADFAPESVGVVHMVEMGEFMDNDVVAQDFRNLHKANIERDGAIATTTTPTGRGMAEATLVIFITVELGVVFEAIREVFLRFFHEDAFLSVAGALALGALEGDFVFDEVAIDLEKATDQKIASVLRNGHL